MGSDGKSVWWWSTHVLQCSPQHPFSAFNAEAIRLVITHVPAEHLCVPNACAMSIYGWYNILFNKRVHCAGLLQTANLP